MLGNNQNDMSHIDDESPVVNWAKIIALLTFTYGLILLMWVIRYLSIKRQQCHLTHERPWFRQHFLFIHRCRRINLWSFPLLRCVFRRRLVLRTRKERPNEKRSRWEANCQRKSYERTPQHWMILSEFMYFFIFQTKIIYQHLNNMITEG